MTAKRKRHSRKGSSDDPEPQGHWYLAKAVATFDADPYNHSQISITRSDVVEVSCVRGEFWLARNIYRETGFVPSKYLCIFDAHLTMHAGSKELREASSQDWTNSGKVLVVKAAVPYRANPAFPNELSFEKDEVLEVTEREPGWWNARNRNGETGIVPSPFFIYAEEARLPSPATPASEYPSSDLDDMEIRSETSETTLVDTPDEFDLLDNLDIAHAVATASDRPISRIGTVLGWRER